MEVMIPASKVGLIIGRNYILLFVIGRGKSICYGYLYVMFYFAGKGGETIKNLQVRFVLCLFIKRQRKAGLSDIESIYFKHF